MSKEVTKLIATIEKQLFQLSLLQGFNGPFDEKIRKRLNAIQNEIQQILSVSTTIREEKKPVIERLPCGNPGCIDCQDGKKCSMGMPF